MTHSSKYGHVQSWGFLPDRWACFQPWIILTYQWILYLLFIIFKINQVALKHWQKDWQNNNKKNGCTMYNLSNGHLSKVPILEGFPLRHTRLILVLNNLASVFRWFFVQNMGHGIGAFQYFFRGRVPFQGWLCWTLSWTLLWMWFRTWKGKTILKLLSTKKVVFILD